jgi:hypothetical protein
MTLLLLLAALTTTTKAQSPPTTCPTTICYNSWPTTTNVKSVDYLIIGGGIAGSVSLFDLARADPSSSFMLVEREPDLGGNYQDIPVNIPAGYKVNDYSPPLIAGMGGMRVNLLTMLNERRLFAELNATVYFTPYRNRQVTRGKDELCDGPDAHTIFADFCSKRFIPQFTGLPPGDFSFNTYCYLTNSKKFPCNYGDHPVPRHPITGKECNRKLDGSINKSPFADPKLKCPTEACKDYPDWKSFLQAYLSPEAQVFIDDDNTGFFGDANEAHSACDYLNWVTREWNTASVVGYPVGGIQNLVKRAVQRGMSAAPKTSVYKDDAVICVRRSSTAGSGSKYEVLTKSGMVVQVNKFLILAIPAPDIEQINGNLIDDIKSKPLFKKPVGISVVTVAMQWPPGQKAWFYPLLDLKHGNYTYRAYGDKNCFARLEIVDIPANRYANVVRVVYSDFMCKDMWKQLIAESQQEDGGNGGKVLENRVMFELRSLFPQFNIPPPVRTVAKVWKNGWFYGRINSAGDATDLSNWATNPLGMNEPLCLVADGFNLYYSGWGEAALISSRNCLTTRFKNSGAIGTKLLKNYHHRDSILKDNYDLNVACPSPLKNEICGPYHYQNDGTLGAPFCAGSKGESNPVCVKW